MEPIKDRSDYSARRLAVSLLNPQTAIFFMSHTGQSTRTLEWTEKHAQSTAKYLHLSDAALNTQTEGILLTALSKIYAPVGLYLKASGCFQGYSMFAGTRIHQAQGEGVAVRHSGFEPSVNTRAGLLPVLVYGELSRPRNGRRHEDHPKKEYASPISDIVELQRRNSSKIL